ncbi:MAG: hypothetical protein CUN54_05610 [Phototrophicales bacterium]|nr:MAG: hypothetical protein CUN54_05610 [Phototrophicales bacterium]
MSIIDKIIDTQPYHHFRHQQLLWMLLIPILLFATWRGSAQLDADSVRNPELISLAHVGFGDGPVSPGDVWNHVRIVSPAHVPGYFFLLDAWGILVGWSPAMLRAFSLFAGIIALAWTYRLGRDTLSPQIGLYAAVALALSGFLTFYLHELRMYSLVVATTAFEFWIYHRIVSRQHAPRWYEWGALFLSTVMLIYTHLTAIFPLAAIGIYHLLFIAKTRCWWSVLIVMGFAGTTFLPWLPVTLRRFQDVSKSNHHSSTDVLHPFALVERMVALFSNNVAIIFVIIAILAAIAWLTTQRGAKQTWIWLLAALLAAIVSNAVANFIPLRRMRYLLPLWPLLALIVGLGIVQLRPRYRYLATPIIFGVWLFTGITLDLSIIQPRSENSLLPYHLVARELEDVAQRGDLLIHINDKLVATDFWDETRFVGDYYFREMIANGVDDMFFKAPGGIPLEDATRLLRQVAANRLRIWLAYVPGSDPDMETAIDTTLRENYAACPAIYNTTQLRITSYIRQGFSCDVRPDVEHAVVEFDEAIVLYDVVLASQLESVQLLAGWSIGTDVPPETYSYSFQLFDEHGDKVAQSDDGLPSESFRWTTTSLPIEGLPPGEYRLMVAVYAWQTGEKLMGVNAAGERITDFFPVETITIGSR